MTEDKIRLQRFLSNAGVCSRRAGEEFITAGRVAVNGEVVTELGTKVDPAKDKVEVDRQEVRIGERLLFLFHKPRGVVTSLSDPQGRRCIAEFVHNMHERVYPVGRLDIDVSGLLLLTNDGEFANKMCHPSNEVSRTYVAKLSGKLSSDKMNSLREGVMLPDGPGQVNQIRTITPEGLVAKMLGDVAAHQSVVEVVVKEGRNHFVKNIFAAVDTPVLMLSRIKFGEYSLDDLERGKIRQLKLKNTSLSSS